MTFVDPESKLQLVGYLGSYDSLSVLVLREVRQKGVQPNHIFPPPQKKIITNPCSSLYRLEHAKFVFILKFHIAILRGFPC